MEHIAWDSTAQIVQHGSGLKHSGTLSSCLLYWRDEMSDVRQVMSFVVVDEPVAGKLRLNPEDLLQMISGKISPQLKSAY
jgi:hypothetical protein